MRRTSAVVAFIIASLCSSSMLWAEEARVGVASYVYPETMDYARGYKALLKQRGIRFDELDEGLLRRLPDLMKYDALVLVTGTGRTPRLSAHAARAVTTFLAFGGRVLLEQHAAQTFDQLPIGLLKSSRLESLDITDPSHPITKGFRRGQSLRYGGTGDYPLRVRDGVRVLAESDGKPTLLVAPVGRGLMIYSGVCMGLVAPRYPKDKHYQLCANIIDFLLSGRYEPNEAEGRRLLAEFLEQEQRELSMDEAALRCLWGETWNACEPSLEAAHQRVGAAHQDAVSGKLERRELVKALRQARKAHDAAAASIVSHVKRRPIPVPRDHFGLRVRHYRYPASLTAADAERAALRFFRMGANLVLTEGHRHHILHPNRGATATRHLVKACHRFGIRVVHHATAVFTKKSFLDKHPTWAQRDAITGEIAFFKSYGGTYMICLNNPEFRQVYFDTMRRFREETGVDGFMVDEVEWLPDWLVCGCACCREKFRAETGNELPRRKDSPVWRNFESPVWRAWIRSRMRWVGDFYADFAKAVLNPGDVWMGCLAGGGTTWMPIHWGDALEEFVRSHNVAFWEACHPNGYHCWLADAPTMAYYTGVARFRRISALTLYYPCQADEQFFLWAYVKAFGHGLWVGYSSATRDDVTGEFFNFERAHEPVYRRPRNLANVAVLFSRQSRDAYYGPTRPGFLTEYQGWCQALTEGNIPYDVILDAEVKAERLSAYRLVILPEAACLADSQLEGLRAYVERGGTMIYTDKTGLYDETGAPRPGGRPKWMLPKPESKTATLAEWTFARGRVVALPGRLASQGWVPRAAPGRKWSGAKDDSARERLRHIVLRLVARDLPFVVEGAPWGFLVTAQRITLPDKRAALAFHFVNATGARLNRGTVVPAIDHIEWRPVRAGVRVRLRAAQPADANLISPDWRGTKKLRFTRTNDGYLTTLPSIRRYAALVVSVRE